VSLASATLLLYVIGRNQILRQLEKEVRSATQKVNCGIAAY
jgi:hypothetical protein